MIEKGFKKVIIIEMAEEQPISYAQFSKIEKIPSKKLIRRQ